MFMSRLLNWLRDVYDQSSNISVPTLVQKDIKWWLSFLPLYNGISMMYYEEWSRPDEIFSSDACLTGCGGWFKENFFIQYFQSLFWMLNYTLTGLNCCLLSYA